MGCLILISYPSLPIRSIDSINASTRATASDASTSRLSNLDRRRIVEEEVEADEVSEVKCGAVVGRAEEEDDPPPLEIPLLPVAAVAVEFVVLGVFGLSKCFKNGNSNSRTSSVYGSLRREKSVRSIQ